MRAAEAMGLILTKSTQFEDRHRHVDFWMSFDGKGNWGVDVYAFEAGGFSVVNRDELAFFCEKHVRKEVAKNKGDAYLKLYTRKDRKDVITKLYLSDIQTLKSYRVWKYFNDYR